MGRGERKPPSSRPRGLRAIPLGGSGIRIFPGGAVRYPVAMERICVFCGAHTGAGAAYANTARVLGMLLADRGITLVTGGGSVGLMGVVADAALSRGGEVIGVIPRVLKEKDLAHTGTTQMVVTEDMHERKRVMHGLSDGFITLPGGMGSLEEMLEALTWLQLGFHSSPVGILNVAGYYDSLLAQLSRAEEEGFLGAHQRDLLLVEEEPRVLLDRMVAWKSPGPVLWAKGRDGAQ